MTETRIRVSTGGRLQLGFRYFGSAGSRVFGGVGVGIDQPRTAVSVRPADRIVCEHDRAKTFANRSVELLSVPGAEVTVEEELPVHHGYGSGTRLALATYTAIAEVYGERTAIREAAANLGRGRRSAAGIETFERGGLALDAGQPSSILREGRPWDVPKILGRFEVPEGWRFLLVTPAIEPGESGSQERHRIRRAIEHASTALDARARTATYEDLLPGIITKDLDRFGSGITALDRVTGEAFAQPQEGLHRETCGRVLDILLESAVLTGGGQSSWGPLVYACTDSNDAERAAQLGQEALREVGAQGTVRVVRPAATGRQIDAIDGIQTNQGAPPNTKE